ncbi:MAG: hypothetical protein IPO80_06180 [Propionibacteriaceae bacterium]|nr:hypothetical protein [Propionibacteriaceae bacterium]
MRNHHVTSRRRWAVVGTTMMALVLALQVLAGINAPPGEAVVYTRATIVLGVTLPGGPGHSAPVKAVVWKNGGKKGFCIEFGMDWPTAAGTKILSAGDRVPGMSAASSAKAKFIANKYAATTNRRTAAAAALAIWTLESNARFDTWWAWASKNGKVDAAMQAEVAGILAEAGQFATVKMTITGNPVDYLEAGTVTISLRSHDGPVKGRLVTLSHTGVRVLSAPSRSDADGLIVVTYQRTTVSGEVAFTASIEGPSTSKAGVSNSSRLHQMTLSGGFTEVKKARLAYQRTLGSPTVSSTCGTDCDGSAAVEFRACNTDGASPIQYPVVNQDGRTIATLDVPAGDCTTKLVTAQDRDELLVDRYCHVASSGGACVTGYVKVKEVRHLVDCPAWASVEVTLGCNCATSWSRVNFSLRPGSPRRYEGTVTFSEASGLKPQTVRLIPGQTTTLTIGQVVPAGTVINAGFTIRDEAGKLTTSESLVVVQVMK